MFPGCVVKGSGVRGGHGVAHPNRHGHAVFPAFAGGAFDLGEEYLDSLAAELVAGERDIPLLCAGSLLVLAPTLLIFLIFQRRFVAALLQGSLKG